MKVIVRRDGTETECEVDVQGIRITSLFASDMSDPLRPNTFCTRAGGFSTMVELPPEDPPGYRSMVRAIAATLAVYLDLAPEIRDEMAKIRK